MVDSELSEIPKNFPALSEFPDYADLLDAYKLALCTRVCCLVYSSACHLFVSDRFMLLALCVGFVVYESRATAFLIFSYLSDSLQDSWRDLV